MTTISIGATIVLALGKPATEDAAGYEALASPVEVGEVVSIGTMGDTSEDVAVTKLKDGRTEHFNGAKDGGAVPVSYVDEAADPGQAFVELHSNTNVTVSAKVTDAAGVERWSYGRLANFQGMEKTATSYDGHSFEFRRNSGTVKITA
jgi:hypothetical protein